MQSVEEWERRSRSGEEGVEEYEQKSVSGNGAPHKIVLLFLK